MEVRGKYGEEHVYENMQSLKEMWVPRLLSLAVREVKRAAAANCLQSNIGTILRMGNGVVLCTL